MTARDVFFRVLGHPGRLLAVSVGVGGLVLGAGGVFASIAAQATATQNLTSGTLRLNLSTPPASAGFTTSIANMVPGDVRRRLVTVANTGDVAGGALTLTLGSEPTNVLAQQLDVTVNRCATPTYPGSTLSCNVVGPTLLSGKASALNGSTVQVDDALLGPEEVYIQVTFGLPDPVSAQASLTTTNGLPSAVGYQGKSATVTFTFDVSQAASTITNS